MLQIAEDAAGVQQAVNLRIKRALALVYEMMNREAGHDSIKLAQSRQRLIEIVRDHSHRGISGKALGSGFQHRRREVDGHGIHCRLRSQPGLDQGEQPAIAGTKIEDAARGLRNKLQQRRFAFRPVRNGIGALQIVASVAGGSPEIDGSSVVMFGVMFVLEGSIGKQGRLVPNGYR